jgi:acyl-CoA hydrolase
VIAAEVEDGACLQIGIGGSVRDIGVHTEMMTDGIAELYKAGRSLVPGKR